MSWRYQNLDFFLLRAPALPARVFLDLMSDTDTRDRLGALADVSEVRRALFVASPDLVTALNKMDVAATGKRAERAYSRLTRYLTRMSTRPTPFGEFSGVALGEFGQTTTARLGPTALCRRRVRADMSWLLGLIKNLESDPDLRTHLRIVLNSSVYVNGDRAVLPYADVYGQNDNRVVSVRATAAVAAAMRLAAMPILYKQFIEELSAEFPEAGHDKITGLVHELWELNVFTSDLRPSLTVAFPEQHVVKRLMGVAPAAAVVKTLQRTIEVSKRSLAAGTADLVELSNLHLDLVPTHRHQTYQLDSVLDLRDPHLNNKVGQEVAGAVDCLMRLSAAVPGHNHHLAQYRDAFTDRYGHNALVPVLEVLNPNTGIDAPPTYTQPPRTYPLPPATPPDSVEADRLLMEFAAEAWWEGTVEVELTDRWVERLAPREEAPPLALYPVLDAYAQLQVRGPIENGNWRVVLREEALAYGGRTFGRFFDLLGESTMDRLREYAEREERLFPDVVYAELSYLPLVGRAANVALRPRVRDYEVPINTTPSVAADRIITLDDLHLGAGEDRLYLWSQRLGKQVVVTQAHMLSPHVAPNVARFLLEVSNDGYVMPCGFRWGTLASMPFLPRIARGRAVLRPAQWTLREEMLVEIDPDFDVALRRWREKWRVPRYVYIVDDDNRLLVDLDHPMGIAELAHEVRKGDRRVTVHEMLPTFGEQWLADENGETYCDEIVVPLIVREAADAARSPLPISRNTASSGIHLHMPGGLWSFIKLYSSFSQHDGIIASSLRSLVESLRAEDVVDRWFYIRYADPSPHLRIRFRAVDEEASPYVLHRLMAWSRDTISAGHAVEFTVDGYRPEVDRYGGPHTFDPVERFFEANSDVSGDLVALLCSDEDFKPELVAVAAVDTLYAQFGLDLTARSSLVPHGDDSPEARRVFHEHRTYLGELLVPWHLRPHERGRAHHDVLASLFARQVDAATVAARAVDRAEATGVLSSGRASVLGSLAHMQINRLMSVDLLREGRCYTIWRHVLRSIGGRPRKSELVTRKRGKVR